MNIKNQDTVTKLLDMVPDLIERFTGEKKNQRKMKKRFRRSLVKDIVSSADKKEENESTKEE